MKKIVLAAFAAAVAFPAAAAPGDTDSANGTATAEIVAPITILNTGNGLNFGTIAPDSTTAGSVQIGLDNSVTATDVVLVTGGTGTGADAFTVSGTSGQTYLITVPETVDLTRSGGTETMTASLLSGSTGGTFGAEPDVFAVGGTLSVAAGQTPGVYSGTYTVTADYQ